MTKTKIWCGNALRWVVTIVGGVIIIIMVIGYFIFIHPFRRRDPKNRQQQYMNEVPFGSS